MMNLFSIFKNDSYKKQLKKLYSRKGYQVIPELPNDNECKRILSEYKTFPFSLVQKLLRQMFL